MKTASHLPAIKNQQGIALLMLVIIIALAASSYYFSSISLIELNVNSEEKTRKSLKQAKNALLSYAVSNWNLPSNKGKIGKLPCTDSGVNNPVGEQEPTCGNAYANAIGYFPWRTLGQNILKDSSGSCLFYAVSPGYKLNPFVALNPDSYGQFRVVDKNNVIVKGDNFPLIPPEDRPVAVVFSPGSVLNGQARNNLDKMCGADYDNIAAYLDFDGTTDNAAINPGIDNVIENVVQKFPGSEQGINQLNDDLITITHKEFWAVMDSTVRSLAFTNRMQNLTEALARCFAGYGSNNTGHLPMPVALNVNGGDYRQDSAYKDSNVFTVGFAGRLPYDATNSNTKLVNGNNPIIFENNYCDAIELVSTVGMPDNINFSDDLGDDKGEYYDLWRNWKDHFFYAISKDFNPSVITNTGDGCPADCININGTDYAAIVFFSGHRQAGQTRYSPPDGAFALDGIDDKDDVINYLENSNAANFPDNSGNGSYSAVGVTSNDVMYCIKPDMSVEQCL